MPEVALALLRSPLPYPLLLAAFGLLAGLADLLRAHRGAHRIASTLLRWQLLAGLAPSLAADALLLRVHPATFAWAASPVAAAACLGLALLAVLAAFGRPLLRLGALLAPAPMLYAAGHGATARIQLGMLLFGTLLLAIETITRPRRSLFARTRL